MEVKVTGIATGQLWVNFLILLLFHADGCMLPLG